LPCAEQLRLIGEYKNAVRYHSECVNKYAELAASGANKDVELLRELTRKAWDAAEKARVALARHVGQHCCEASSSEPSVATVYSSRDETISNVLQHELETAKQRHEAAKRHFTEVSREFYSSGIPASDGHLLFRKALQEENDARTAHVAALVS